MSKKRIIIFSVLGFFILVSISRIFNIKPQSEESVAAAIQSQVLAAMASTSEQKVADDREEIKEITANPQHTSSAASAHATYIVCMPIVTAPGAQVQATSTTQVTAQAFKQVNELPGQMQPIFDTLPQTQMGGSPAPEVTLPQNGANPEPVPPSSGQYMCSADTYNCSDFTTQQEAQSAFETCGGTSNDIHKLDRNNDGKVCVNLR